MEIRHLVRVMAALLAVRSTQAGHEYGPAPKCEKITIRMCEDMPYNVTRMPNLMQDANQGEAAINVHEFAPLVEINCSRHLKFLLCSLYAPMCTEQVDEPIPSCRSICEKVKQGCYPYYQQLGIEWPAALNCSRLPAAEHGLCMESPDVTEDRRRQRNNGIVGGRPIFQTEHRVKIPSPYAYPDHDFLDSYIPTTFDRRPVAPEIPPKDRTSEIDNKKCPANHIIVPGNRHPSGSSCAAKCGAEVLFKDSDKRFSEIWLTVWSILCFVSTLLTIVTFLIDPARFKYPERPIIFVALCYCMFSVGYLIRVVTGGRTISCAPLSGHNESFLIVEGAHSTSCIVVFIILYYFSAASSIWWLVLTLTWYLASGKKWGHEAIESWATYFHVFAWSLPAVKTIFALTFHRIDGDELSGICYTGNQSLDSLLYFVLIPSCIYFAVGGVFLALGFVAMCRIRVAIRQQQRRNPNFVFASSPNVSGPGGVSKLGRLMVRIGVFSLIYSVPALCVIGCQIYEYLNRNEWMKVANQRLSACRKNPDELCPPPLQKSIPPVVLYNVKTFFLFLAGLSTGFWMFNSKTRTAWRSFFSSALFSKRPSDKLNNSNQLSSKLVVRNRAKYEIRSSAV